MMNKVAIGNICKSTNFGDFKIIDQADNTPITINKEKPYIIEFIDTGAQRIASYNAIQHGKVKDVMKPTIANVGYIGSPDIKITTDKYVFMIYRSWNDMLNRCYNINDGDYNYYGMQGVRVSEDWFNFETFLKDIRDIPGYINKLIHPSVYQLDKDLLQMGIPKNKKIYSKETCMWLSKHDNSMIAVRENFANNSGYYGVFYKDNGYHTRINSVYYGSFTIPEAAANLFNYLYRIIDIPFNDILFFNDVPIIPYKELKKYIIPNHKQRWLNDYPEME